MPHTVEAPQQSAVYNTWLEIRLDRLLENLRVIQSCQSAETQVMAVVKANAYGHGLIGTAKCLAPRVRYLAVSSLYEAAELRKHGIETPVFLLSRLLPDETAHAVLFENLTLSVSSYEEASELSAQALRLERKPKVHIKIDTGMGRLGIPFGEGVKTVEKIAALPHLQLEGIYTHFPAAEKSDGFSETQVRDFTLLLQALEKKDITFEFRHAANSAGSLKIKTLVFNMIRPGLMLYGVYPDPSLRPLAQVSPALSLKSRIISLKRFQPGQTIGYGREHIVDKPTTIALLPAGYSHGYPVRASHKAHALVQGEIRPLAGRISMDYLTVDLGSLPARIGDEVILIGESNDQRILAEDVAGWAGTIPYEILTRLSAAMPRRYLS